MVSVEEGPKNHPTPVSDTGKLKEVHPMNLSIYTNEQLESISDFCMARYMGIDDPAFKASSDKYREIYNAVGVERLARTKN